MTLGHGQQLCEILSRSNLAVRGYGRDTDFQYMCTVTLTFEIMTLGHGEQLCEYYQYWTSRYEVQTDGVIPIYPQTVFVGV